MLLHIRPRLFSEFRNVTLYDLEIRPLGIRLSGGVDLVTRRPYPNKFYAVACRKEGRRAIDGLLIETKTPVDEFDVTARWAIEATTVVSHHVHYSVLDHDFDAASDSTVLWHACSAELGGWSSRIPASMSGPFMTTEPVMRLIPRVGDSEMAEETLDARLGWIVCRREPFAMPTIERERILSATVSERMPTRNSVFIC